MQSFKMVDIRNHRSYKMARKAKTPKTPKNILSSNERYREGFLQKAIRFDRIEDFDLLQEIDRKKAEADEKGENFSFNALTIELLRKHFKLNGKPYLAEQKAKNDATKEIYRTAVAYCWSDTRTHQENLDKLNEYLLENHQFTVGEDIQSQAFLASQLKVLGYE